MFNLYAFITSFLGAFVEFVEALTIVLAVSAVRGWKSSLVGASLALMFLVGAVGLVGVPLVQIIHLLWVQLVVGLLMFMFGLRWLYKSILRFAGLKALDNQEESYRKKIDLIQKTGQMEGGLDWVAFSTAFSGTFLEGLHAIFIVITLGLSVNAMSSAVLGALGATIVVIISGFLLRQPLSKVPDNIMKFVVGIFLTSFGSFWIGEGFHVYWPQSDVSILYLAVSLCLFSWGIVVWCKHRMRISSP